jgi:hypothetical protein
MPQMTEVLLFPHGFCGSAGGVTAFVQQDDLPDGRSFYAVGAIQFSAREFIEPDKIPCL